MSHELERTRKRESMLVDVFSAIDAREEAEMALGNALIELRDLGVTQADLADMTGLSARAVGAAIRSVKISGTAADHAAPSDDESGEHHGAEQH